MPANIVVSHNSVVSMMLLKSIGSRLKAFPTCSTTALIDASGSSSDHGAMPYIRRSLPRCVRPEEGYRSIYGACNVTWRG